MGEAASQERVSGGTEQGAWNRRAGPNGSTRHSRGWTCAQSSSAAAPPKGRQGRGGMRSINIPRRPPCDTAAWVSPVAHSVTHQSRSRR